MKQGNGFRRAIFHFQARLLVGSLRPDQTGYGKRPGREKRTSAAKAVKRAAIYGTAEAVPFVGQSLPRGSFGAVQIAQPKKASFFAPTTATRVWLGDTLQRHMRPGQHLAPIDHNRLARDKPRLIAG